MAIKGVIRKNFYHKYLFRVKILGVGSADFQTCGAIEMENADVEHHEGGSLIPFKEPGKVSVPDLELTRGSTADKDLYNWFAQTAIVGVITDFKRTLTISQLNRIGIPIATWSLFFVYPKKWSNGGWDNDVDEVQIESLTLRYDYAIPGLQLV